MFVFNPFTGNFDNIVASLSTLDSRYVNVTGDTMTGPLVVDIDSSVLLSTNTGLTIDVDNSLAGASYGIDINSVSVLVGSAIGLRIAAPSGTEAASAAIQLSDDTFNTRGGMLFGSNNTVRLYKIADSTLQIVGSTRASGYLNVGSTLAPSNTTNGDLTFVRGFATDNLLIDSTSATALTVGSNDTLVVDADVQATYITGQLEFNVEPAFGLTASPLLIYDETNDAEHDVGMTFQIQTGASTNEKVTFGMDNTDDIFKFSQGYTLGTTDLLHLDLSGNMRNPGYLRVGSTSAPTNTTTGDITGVRLMLGTQQTLASALQLGGTGGTTADGITFGTDSNFYRIAAGVLANSGSERISTYLRVGSVSAPNNTTAGDLTVTRIDMGANAAFSATGRLARFSGTMTDTASGAAVGFAYTATINPASASSSSIRALSMSATMSGTETITKIGGGFFETRHNGTGNITTLTGFEGVNFLNGSGFTGTITSAFGVELTAVSTTVNNPACTVTTAAGVVIHNAAIGSGPISITTLIGVEIEQQSTGVTSTFGARIAYPGIASGIVNTTNLTGLSLPTVSRGIGNQTATTTNAFGIQIGIPTWTSTTNTRTITNAAGLYIAGAPVASTNVTITNGPYSIWVDGGTTRLDGELNAQGDIKHDGTNVGFYAAAPVAQATTGIAEATFVENSGGTAVNVDSTFGGYTLQQIAQALQSVGLLA